MVFYFARLDSLVVSGFFVLWSCSDIVIELLSLLRKWSQVSSIRVSLSAVFAFLGDLKFLKCCLPNWTRYCSARLTRSVERSKLTFSSALSLLQDGAALGRSWCLVWFSPMESKSWVGGLGVTAYPVHRCVYFMACQTSPVPLEASSSSLFSYTRKGKRKITTWPACGDEGSLCSWTSPWDLL